MRAKLFFVYTLRHAFLAALILLLGSAPNTHASRINDIIVNTTGVIKNILILVMMVSLVVFGWGIVRLIAHAAGGSPEGVRKAKGIIWWGLIGLTVLASIVGIISFIQQYLGVEGGGTITVPRFTPL